MKPGGEPDEIVIGATTGWRSLRLGEPDVLGSHQGIRGDHGSTCRPEPSFSENEPSVNTLKEVLDCFLMPKMHRLVLGDWTVARGTDGG